MKMKKKLMNEYDMIHIMIVGFVCIALVLIIVGYGVVYVVN